MGLSYDAMRRQAEKHGVKVVSVCHDSLPAGLPPRDHYGNYLNAYSVYFGKDGAVERDCAYATCVQSINQRVMPGTAEALAELSHALLAVDMFASRHDYEDYYRSGCRSACEMEDMSQQFRQYQLQALRAERCLPAELVSWLRSHAKGES